jgi:WD40 repeat protein
VPKVADFGLAKWLSRDRSLTRSGVMMGTPSYIAPEQARAQQEQIGVRTDVYSLGAILYELLTGRPPFQGALPAATLLQVLSKEAVPVRRLQPEVPADLETICHKCLEKDPQRRYASARELAEDLRRFLEGRPIQARPVGAVERCWRWCRRNRLLAVVASLAVVALLTAAVLGTAFGVYASIKAVELAGERDKERTQRELAGDRLRLARSRLAAHELDRALTACITEQDPRQGLLWLARALKSAPEEDQDLQYAIRTNLDAWRREVPPVKVLAGSGPGGAGVVFTPDGQTLVACAGSSAQLWDVPTASLRGEPLCHESPLVGVAVRPDGRRVLTASEDGTVRQWDPATGKPIGPALAAGALHATAVYSPNGRWLAATGIGRLWDADTGAVRFDLPHPARVLVVAFSPDSRQVLTGCSDRKARLWDVATGKLVSEPFAEHERELWWVAFSPDGKTLLVGDGMTFQLRNASTHKLIAQGLKPYHLRHTPWHAGRGCLFSPDGRTVLTGYTDGSAQLWDAATGDPLGPPLAHGAKIESVAFAPDGHTILTAGSGMVRLWPRDEAARRNKVGGELAVDASFARWPSALKHQGWETSLAFSPDGRTLATGDRDRAVRLWELGPAPGTPHRVLAWNARCRAVAFSPDSQKLLVGVGGQARLYDVEGQALGPPVEQSAHLDGVRAVAFSPDGESFVTCSERMGQTAMQRWDARPDLAAPGGWKKLGPPFFTRPNLMAAAFSPDGRLLLTRGDDVQLWDLTSGECLGAPGPEHGWARTAGASWREAFSLDGTLVLRSEGRTARLTETATGKALGQALVHPEAITVMTFSPDDKALLTGTADGTIQLWDVRTCKPIGPAWRHQRTVFASAFSPDGKKAATGDQLAVRVWEVPAPLTATPEQIELWAQVLTGLELDEHNVVRALDAASWQDRRRRLLDFEGDAAAGIGEVP